MARRPKKDPLRYAANLTGLSAAAYLGVTALLRLGVGGVLRLLHRGATLRDPMGAPEWLLGLCNIVLPAAGVGAALWLMCAGMRAVRVRPQLQLRPPRDRQLWLFLPVFLGVSFLGSLLTALMQRVLAACTNYRAPEPVRLPESGFALALYFIGVCAVPAVLEELLLRGAVQTLLSRWGAWFSIVVSSVVFALLHSDPAQMPALFFISVLLGLAMHCIGSPGLGAAMHFAYNTMGFLFLYALQKLDGVSAFAFAGYLVAVLGVSAAVCAVQLRRRGVLRRFRPIPRIYDPKNRQSRLERLACAPIFLCVMVGLAVRAVWPLFAG